MALLLLLWLQLGQVMPSPAPPPPPGAPKAEAPVLGLTARFVEENSDLEITWTNRGHLGLYVQMGSIAGRMALMNLKFRREGGGEVLNNSEPGVIAGTLQPYVLFLPPGGRFVHRIPATLLYDMTARRSVAELKGENFTLTAEFVYQPATQADIRLLEFATAGIWTGRLTAKASLVRPGGAGK
ncbi:MAG: hypothetical protein J0H49_00960 [Acidobacteria bacterium]|nr:hypothetical protein [Acidobacteriota bacterium]